MRLTLGILAAAVTLSATPVMAQAPGETSAVTTPSCDRDCLIGFVRSYMKALPTRDPSQLKLAHNVRYAENNVLIPVGEGLWDTVDRVDEVGLEAADPSTGNAAWFGSVIENGHPAIYAMRLRVKNGAIDEIEAVVHRKTTLPAPFGDVTKMVHDPEFNEVLPPEQRRPRERMLSIADGYFSTVELNDGQVFAPFTDDCARLENGISTTTPTRGSTGGNAASIASGCREQFELGIYKINKRVRRDFFIVDEERGVAVGRGFFDHANEWDRYLLTNGREMKTALKWPNSITLLEAFRVRNAEISRVEAVFTYVPYFMQNPFWDSVSTAPDHAARIGECDTACLTGQARSVMSAYVGNKWSDVKWADEVGYAENSVGIRVGEGIWATVTAIDASPLIIADGSTGKVIWIGRIEEHGQPAWGAITVTSAGSEVGAIDALIRRKEYGAPYAEPNGAPNYANLPVARRTSRAAMLAGAEGAYAAINSHSGAPAGLASNCHWFVNGQDVGDCTTAFSSPHLREVSRVRDREVVAVDEARGLVAYRTFEDVPAINGTGYPLTLQVIDVFRFDGGGLAEVQAYTSELPYGMRPQN
jgi:hypothetical protein